MAEGKAGFTPADEEIPLDEELQDMDEDYVDPLFAAYADIEKTSEKVKAAPRFVFVSANDPVVDFKKNHKKKKKKDPEAPKPTPKPTPNPIPKPKPIPKAKAPSPELTAVELDETPGIVMLDEEEDDEEELRDVELGSVSTSSLGGDGPFVREYGTKWFVDVSDLTLEELPKSERLVIATTGLFIVALLLFPIMTGSPYHDHAVPITFAWVSLFLSIATPFISDSHPRIRAGVCVFNGALLLGMSIFFYTAHNTTNAIYLGHSIYYKFPDPSFQWHDNHVKGLHDLIRISGTTYALFGLGIATAGFLPRLFDRGSPWQNVRWSTAYAMYCSASFAFIFGVYCRGADHFVDPFYQITYTSEVHTIAFYMCSVSTVLFVLLLITLLFFPTRLHKFIAAPAFSLATLLLVVATVAVNYWGFPYLEAVRDTDDLGYSAWYGIWPQILAALRVATFCALGGGLWAWFFELEKSEQQLQNFPEA